MILLILLTLVLTFGLWRWFRFTTCNLLYIATHLGKVRKGKQRLAIFMYYAVDLLAFDTWISDVFKYKSDKFDYAEWPLVFAMKRWYGDCDAVASLAWKWAERNGYPATYVSIKRVNMVGHAVCLVKVDGKWNMVDSTGIVDFTGWATHYPNCKIIIRKTR